MLQTVRQFLPLAASLIVFATPVVATVIVGHGMTEQWPLSPDRGETGPLAET